MRAGMPEEEYNVRAMSKISHILLKNPVVADKANLDIPVDDIMYSPELTIDSDKWLTDAIVMFERCKASQIAVVEHGEKVGIIRADDILHTYRFNAFNAESQY